MTPPFTTTDVTTDPTIPAPAPAIDDALARDVTGLELPADGRFRFGQFTIDKWLKTVPNGYLKGTRFGRAPSADVPDILLKEGPLREVYLLDLALFVGAERAGVKIAAGMTRLAPDDASLTFLATQTLDEARHFETFAQRATDLGVPPELRDKLSDDVMPPAYRTFLAALLAAVEGGDYEAGLVGLNIILEGMAFPLYEYEMRYWRPFDPGLVQIVENAFKDECRHTGFGEKHLAHVIGRDPGARRRVQRKVDEFAALLRAAFGEFLGSYVALYDHAVREHPERCAGVEIIPGRALLDTPCEDQVKWLEREIAQGHARRLARIGLELN